MFHNFSPHVRSQVSRERIMEDLVSTGLAKGTKVPELVLISTGKVLTLL